VSKCILCDNNAEVEGIGELNTSYRFKCVNCGNYIVEDYNYSNGMEERYNANNK